MSIPNLTSNKIIARAGASNFGKNSDTNLVSTHSSIDVDEQRINIEAIFRAQSSKQKLYDVQIVADSITGDIISTVC
jgi:hypothetical protein